MSGNRRTVNAGAARWAYQDARLRWKHVVQRWRVKDRVERADGPRRVVIVRCYGGGSCTRRLDRDNAWAGLKPLLDALVHQGLLVDDSDRHAEVYLLQEEARRGESGTVVTIEDLT